MKIFSVWSRSRLFCLEPTQVGRSRSRLRDLGHPEPEPPKKSGGFATLVITGHVITSQTDSVIPGQTGSGITSQTDSVITGQTGSVIPVQTGSVKPGQTGSVITGQTGSVITIVNSYPLSR